MDGERFKSCRDPGELDSLFMEIQGYFDDLFRSACDRRNIERSAGMDISQDNKKLNETLDKLNLGLEPLRKSVEGGVHEEHIMALIDAVLDLLAFTGNKGAIKPELKAKIDEMTYKENKVFGERNKHRDKLMFLLSIAGTSLEVCTANILHAAIFALNSHLSGDMVRSDSAIISDPQMAGIAQSPLVNTLVKKTGRTPPQIFAHRNKIRTYLLVAGLSFMTANSIRSMKTNHTLSEVISSASDPSNAKINANQRAEFLLKFALSTIRLLLISLLGRRLIDTVKTFSSIDYAAYQRFKLEEIEAEKLDSSQLNSFKKLFSELQKALERMSADDKYDPTPLIEKIKEALETVAAGESIHVKSFLEPSRKIVQKERKQRAVLDREVENDSAVLKIVQSIRKRVLTVVTFELPPVKNKLSREERKELYTRNKAAAATRIDVKPELVPQEDKTETLPVAREVVILNEREQLIRRVEFHRTLDGTQFRRFLKAMSFKKESGKGSHEKYSLEAGGGSIIVILSRTFDRFDDKVIKDDILRRSPYLNPEWVYWMYCKQFGFPESISDYQKFFGKEFDANDEQSQ